ncbi:unnamed protein product, partial [Candidula unifasciata]
VMKFAAQTRNNMSVGELWFRLLRFYCLELDIANTVVSIRTDQQIPRNTKPWNSKKLAVEDPYMLKKNVTGMVNQAHVCEYWEDCIRRALHYFGFPRDAEGRSHIPIDAFIKMIQNNETTEAATEEDKAVQQSAVGDGSVQTNKTDRTHKTQYQKNSQQQTLPKDDQSSSDSGNDDFSDSDTEDSDDDGVTEDQHSAGTENLHKQSSEISAGSKSQTKSAALKKLGNHSKPAVLLENQSLRKDISDSGISDGLSQTPDNGYFPHQVMQEGSVGSSPNDSKHTVITSQTDSLSHASKQLSLSSLGSPAEAATGDATDHLKLTEAMNDIFLLLEKRDCYYVFSKEVLTDGKGPVLLCAYCEKTGHLKNACPEDKLPEIFPLPPLTALHVKVLSETLSRLPGLVGLSSCGSSSRFSFLKDLEAFIRTHFDDANLTLFGSSCNGFGFERSDMDICLTFSQRKIIDKPWVIESLARKMKQSKDLIRVQAISTAKVPIVKFVVRNLGLEGDISLYNILAQHNTRLLLCYSQIDPRVQILGYAIKHFAKVCDIGDASRGSLSSYAYILMMIYYLQQVSPPVLPVLQELYESKEKPQLIVEECDVWFMDDLKKLNTLWSDKGKNKMSPAELWIGFLRFYVEEFNCKEIVVSIRQKEPVTRFDKLWNGENIAIEDPFDHSHNLGSGLTRNMNNFIFKTFINGRMLHGSPIDNNMELYSKYRNPYDYFFDSELLSESRPPNIRGCHFCGKIGHLARHCTARKSNPLLSQQDNQQKQRQASQLQLKPQASLAQSVLQEKQLIDPKQPNLPSQERPRIQQLQQPSRYSQQGENAQPKQSETKEFPHKQQEEQYNKPLDKQQNQKQMLQPHQEERKQNQPLQQQAPQTKQHQTSQSSHLQQYQQQQKQPLLQQPLHSVQLQEEHQQVQSSQQKQPSMTQQQLEPLSRLPSQTNQQNMQPFQPQQHQQIQPPHQQQQQQRQHPQEQQRQPLQQQQQQLPQEQQQEHKQPPHQQQQQQKQLPQEQQQLHRQPPHQQQQQQRQLPQEQQHQQRQPPHQQQLRQPFLPRQQHPRPSEHQIRHAMPLQEKQAFRFHHQQPSQMPHQQQNQYRQQHPQSQQQHPQSQQQHPQSQQQQQYHHSQVQ